jgi:hypothetical protein
MCGLAQEMAPWVLSPVLSGWAPAYSEGSIDRMTLTEATGNYY